MIYSKYIYIYISFFAWAASILSGCLLSSPAGFAPNCLLVFHPLVSPRNVHLSAPHQPPTPGLCLLELQVKLENTIFHQSAESAAHPPPTHSSMDSPQWLLDFWRGGVEKSPPFVAGSCIGGAAGSLSSSDHARGRERREMEREMSANEDEGQIAKEEEEVGVKQAEGQSERWGLAGRGGYARESFLGCFLLWPLDHQQTTSASSSSLRPRCGPTFYLRLPPFSCLRGSSYISLRPRPSTEHRAFWATSLKTSIQRSVLTVN